ncbi:MAG: protein kinase [Gemmatimonadota bacterium]
MSGVPSRLVSALADRYRIERELGEGGMATVYLAEDLRHHREVAIKVLRPELAASLGPERFMQEIEIAARLQHPHILPVHDSGEADGFLYYVMPYVEGESLRERLARHGELPIGEAVRLLIEVADALAYAHAQGVVHRDIKPDNIMLSGRHALVMDFGVAKAVSEASGRSQLTTVGMALGTPAYMAPEQASADPNLDQRVDIYALGVLGYELLSGSPPFTGTTPQQVLAAQVTTTPQPLAVRRPTASPALEAVIMRALEKRPADRWQTADEMLAQLDMLATPSGAMTPTGTSPARVTKGRKRRPVMIAAIGAGAVLVLAATGVALSRRGPPPLAALGKSDRVTRSAGVQELPRITADGKGVAYALIAPGDSAEHVEFRRTDGGAAVTLATNAMPLAWSPDGDRLLVATDRGLESVPALGGAGRLLVPKARFGTWSPGGHRLAFIRGDSLMVRDDGGHTAFLARSLDSHSLVWSPDGRWIAFVSGNTQWLQNWNIAPSSLWLVSAAGGKAIRLTSGNAMNQSPTWAPGSRRLLFVSNRNGTRDIYQLNLTRNGRPAKAPIQLTHGLNASLISLAPDGKSLAYSVATDHSNIWSVGVPDTGWVSSRTAEEVTTDRERIEVFDISRDGKWLVFDSDRAGIQQIFRRPLAGGQVQQITHDTVPAFAPSVSPDGSEVAYHVIVHGLRRVFETAADGSSTPVQVSPGRDTDEYGPVWSPDGKRIAWVTGPYPTATQTDFATREGQKWGPAEVARGDPGDALWPRWADSTSLFGTDSNNALITVAIAGPKNRRVLTAGGPDPQHGPVKLFVPSVAVDAAALIGAYEIEQDGRRQDGIYRLTPESAGTRFVVHFDDPLHPHRDDISNITEQGGRLYFTLESPESSVWTVSITGLAR